MRLTATDRQTVVRIHERVLDARDVAPVTRGLGALYTSDDGVTLNALAVSALRDFAPGAACDLTQGTGANQPTFVPGAVGARSALRFDGSNDQLSRAIVAGVKPSARGLSVVFVAQGRSGSTGDYPPLFSARPWSATKDEGWAISCNGSGTSGYLTAHYATGGLTGFDHADSGASAGVGVSKIRRELWCVVFDDVANELRWYRNGSHVTTGTPTFPSSAPTPTADFRIGADRAVGTGTRFLAMDLFRAAIHTEPLTVREVETYWARWGSLCGVQP